MKKSILATIVMVALLSSSSRTYDDWKKSTSYTKNDHGNVSTAAPVIEIKESAIKIVHRVEGGGKIMHTALEGSGGKYRLQQGDNTVNPGTYTQTTVGTVLGSNSAMYSDVYYK